ncbi:MAG: hypothetical protein H6605_06230 [Flavobacteriales bacterium]|nr:hypothetical protein [Flavobacteriales bacterium]
MKTVKPYLEYILPVLFFALLTYLYMAPAFDGKVIKQGDIQQYTGASKEIADYKEKEGKGPLWTNSMFGGMPSYQISYEPPNNYASFLRKITLIKHPANTLFSAMIFSFILLLTFGVNPWISAIGAIAYAFSSYNLILLEAGHNTKLYAIAYAPLFLAGFNLLLKQKWLIGAALASAGMALQMQANHFQITYYLGLIIGMWSLSEMYLAYKNSTFKNLFMALGIFAAASLIGMGTNSVSLILTQQYAAETIRGKSELTITPDAKKKTTQSSGLDLEYAFDWSQGWEDLPTILIPNFAGGGSGTELGSGDKTKKLLQQMTQSSNPQQAQQAQQILSQKINPWAYWGSLPFTSGPVYFGALVLFLFFAGIFYSKSPSKWWWLAALVVSLMLSMGKNMMWFNGFLFHYLPFYNKFRSVNMSLVIGQIAVAIYAVISLSELLKQNANKDQVRKALKYSLYLTGGFCLLMVLYSGGAELGDAKEIPAEAIEDRAKYLRMDALRSLFFIAAGFAAFWYYLKEKLKPMHIMLIIGVLVLVDLWSVDRRYLNNKSWEKEKTYAGNFEPSAANLEIMKDTSYYRVFDASESAFNSAKASYFHHSIGGYHAAKLRRYQEVIEWHITKNDMDIANMLNVKYYIVRDQETGTLFSQPNPEACGNAWFVDEYKMMENSDQEIQELGKIDPKKTTLIDKRFESQVKGLSIVKDSLDYIKLESYHPDVLKYSYQASHPRLAVFSEIYYNEKKGWNAYIDNNKVPHFRCNYILRGMKLPEGKHSIEFRFEPENYELSSSLALASNAGMYVLLILGIGSLIFGRNKQTPAKGA